MVTRHTTGPRGRSRLVEALVLVAGGSWGAVAGALLLGLLATALGAPTGTGEGEIIPGLGWNAFTAFVIGLPIGFAAGAVAALRASRRWPWLVGLPVAIIGALVIVTSLADPSQWDATFYFLIVPVLPAVAFLAWYLRRRKRSPGPSHHPR
jgi:MFS family permease